MTRPISQPVEWTRPAPRTSLACADWLDLAVGLPPRSVDLLYVDPPFATGRAHRARAGAFDDVWPDLPAYIAWLRERLTATLPALQPAGAVMLHLDWRTSHHARVLLDELIGPDGFVNHLVWTYGLGGSSSRRFARKHDDILFYTLDAEGYYFEAPRVPATSRRLAGETKKATDVLAIPALNNMAAERVGYPTQKPVALLDVLVRAACPPGGTVLDPCCGSGTTLVAACGAGRAAIGGDRNPDAVAITAERLRSLGPTDIG